MLTRPGLHIEELLAEVLRCPACGAPLRLDWTSEGPDCRACGRRSGDASGILDLVTDPERTDERAYYEDEYSRPVPVGGRRSLEGLAALWDHPGKPTSKEMRRRLGDMRGKRVLLVGNGGSAKELHFLQQEPALLLFTDLSAAGVASVRDAYDLSGHEDRVCFAAVDALDLPLADGSVDVVYGNAIVHHLPDRPRFLREVSRVLAPGGEAIFLDDAYSPLWQGAKTTTLRPLFALSHRLYPRSPEDVRETRQGGFKEADLVAEIRAAGGEPWFRRFSLVYYFWRRASLTLAPRPLRRYGEHPLVARPLIAFDEAIARRPRVQPHLIRLLWGMRKPA